MIELKKILDIESTNKYPIVLIPVEIKKFFKNHEDILLRYSCRYFSITRQKWDGVESSSAIVSFDSANYRWDKIRVDALESQITNLEKETIKYYDNKILPANHFIQRRLLKKPNIPVPPKKIDENELIKKHNRESGFNNAKASYLERHFSANYLHLFFLGMFIGGIFFVKFIISELQMGKEIILISVFGVLVSLLLLGLPTVVFINIIADTIEYYKLKKKTKGEYEIFKEGYEIKYKKEFENYEKEKKLYPEKLEEYNQRYSEELKRDEENKKEYNKSLIQKTNEYLFIKYKNNFRSDLVIERAEQVPNKGKSEKIFLKELLNYFNDDIMVDMTIKSRNREIYYPDFIYFERETNLIIDIEIDEEFETSTGRPIHFIGSDDEVRNKFFIENNWFVLRFTEEQVIKNAKECCQFLKDTITKIQNPNFIGVLNRQIDLPQTFRWTYEQAIIKLNL